MNNEELEKVTDMWNLYEIGKEFNRLHNVYTDGRDNYNYFWAGNGKD